MGQMEHLDVNKELKILWLYSIGEIFPIQQIISNFIPLSQTGKLN